MKKILYPLLSLSLSIFIFVFSAIAGGMEWSTPLAGVWAFVGILVAIVATSISIFESRK